MGPVPRETKAKKAARAPIAGAVPGPPRRGRRSVLDQEALGSLHASAWVLAGLYTLFSVTHLVFLEPAARRVMVPLTAAEAALILGLLAFWRARAPTAAAAHRWILLLGILALLNSGTLLFLAGEPKQATNLFFLAIGAGFLFLRRPYLASYLAAVVAVFLGALATSPPAAEWTHYVFGMLSAIALATVIHVVRRASTLRLDLARRTAQESEARLRTVLTGAPLAVMAFDRDGTFLLAEGRALEGVGLRSEDLVGKPVEEAYKGHPGLPLVRRALAGERSRGTVEERGRMFDVEFTPLPGGGAVGVATDVTDRRRAEDATEEARRVAREAERLRELDRLRTSFVNVAAHELNTPLTPIHIQLGMLDSPDEARRAKASAILRRNIDRLARIIRDLVTVNRLEQGRLDVRLRPMDLAEAVRHSVDSFRDPAASAGIDLQAQPMGPAPVRGDAEKLQQVVDNLLTNALKFTPRGGSIRVRSSRQGGMLRVEVEDSGAGIAADEVAMLFRPFSQLEAGRQRGGTGLGLHLSRAILEAHGGRIWATSPGVGKGSTFAFEVPVSPPR